MQPTSEPALAECLTTRLAAIQARIAQAVQAAGRPAGAASLVAVSKTQPMAAVRILAEAGQTTFGENRVQEAMAKFAAPHALPGLSLHLIGGLQTNKAREAVSVATMIEVLDRPSLADALDAAAQKEGRLPRLLVQVNVGDEPQKSGVPTEHADRFITDAMRRFGAVLTGVMCIPPAGPDPAPHFRWLAACAARHGLTTVSMGMSADFELAIACGATLVRVGTALFAGGVSGADVPRLQAHAAPA